MGNMSITEFFNFEKEYKQDINIFQTKTDAQKVINEWINKNPENARITLLESTL